MLKHDHKNANWSVVVLTTARPTPTLDRTLASLEKAGWPEPIIYTDQPPSGHWPAWRAALRAAFNADTWADAFMVVEDDIVFCKGLRAYLSGCLWPEQPERIALVSPYCHAAYVSQQRPWHMEGRGFYLAGSQCWIFPPASARTILTELADTPPEHYADWIIGEWAAKKALHVWYHCPSLAQHIGVGNSTLGSPDGTIFHADDFVGEDYSL
jgi:GR25 family glycosyltransferase involved in LPS biosynthesis